MKKKNDFCTLRDCIAEHGDYKGFVFIHKYNVSGTFKYTTSDVGEKLLSSEVILVQKHTGGRECEYSAITYIIR